MGKTALIIKREYFSRVKKKSFIIMTIVGPLLMAAMFMGAVWLSLSQDEKQKVLIVDELQLFSSLASSSNVSFEHTILDLDSVKSTFHKSDYSAILYLPENILHSNSAILFFKKQPGFIAQKYIESKVEGKIEDLKLIGSKIDKEAYGKIKTHIHLSNISFKEIGKEEHSSQESGFIGLIFAIMIYMFIFLYGVQVMRGVIEEKTSRIIEVIISSVKPFQLMLGKIIGVAFVGLTQFLLWVILTASIVSVAQAFLLKDHQGAENMVHPAQMTSQLLKDNQNQPKAQLDSNEVLALIERINFPYMLGMFLFFFLGGYLLYSAMFAAIGAAVDSESDTQQFMMPVTIPLIFGFIVAQLSLQNPEGPAAVWFSIIPFTSPVVMMVRVAIVPFEALSWQLLLSMVLLILGFLATTWIAAKIYRIGILMYGKKTSYKELWKWITYKG
ncbi:MAG: ABC transporter permease [Bacteroidetes bacterium]|nr:ABC transporter permease [Bacteroidota bacterium]HET6245780.1 ABC transporter permease [Bacteroidia bacterium]